MKRSWIFALAFLLTAGILALSLVLGAWGFDVRRYAQHQGRLWRVMRQQPSAERLTRGLEDEGTALVAVVTGRDELERVVAARGGGRAAEIREKGGRFAETRVFDAADMTYFIYFDEKGVMRDYTCASR